MKYDLVKAKEEILDDLRPSWHLFYLIDADTDALNAGRREANAFLKGAEREYANKEIVKDVYGSAYGKCREKRKKRRKKKGDFCIGCIEAEEDEDRLFPNEKTEPVQADGLLDYEADRILFRYSSNGKYWYPDNAADVIQAVSMINEAIFTPDLEREKKWKEEREYEWDKEDDWDDDDWDDDDEFEDDDDEDWDDEEYDWV